MHSSRRHALLALASLTAVAARPSMAQSSYPDRPVKLVVPYAAGGGTDYFARLIMQPLAEALGQTVLVDNRPGGSGMIGAGAVARSLPADGYNVLLTNKALMCINPVLYDKMPYELAELEPVSMGGRFDFFLVVNDKVLPVKTVPELIAAARAAPAGLDYASPGIGTTHDTGMELLANLSGARFNKVPYKGGGPAVQDLLAGQVGVMCLDRATARPYLQSGKLRAIATLSDKRIPGWTDVPTIAETYKDFHYDDWLGFAVRAGTPHDAVQKFSAAFIKVAAHPDLRKQLADSGIVIEGTTPEDFKRFVSRDAAETKALITRLKIRLS